VLANKSGADQIIIIGEDNICLGLFLREHLLVVANGEEEIFSAAVACFEVKVARAGVTFLELPCSGTLARHGPAEGGQSKNALL